MENWVVRRKELAKGVWAMFPQLEIWPRYRGGGIDSFQVQSLFKSGISPSLLESSPVKNSTDIVSRWPSSCWIINWAKKASLTPVTASRLVVDHHCSGTSLPRKSPICDIYLFLCINIFDSLPSFLSREDAFLWLLILHHYLQWRPNYPTHCSLLKLALRPSCFFSPSAFFNLLTLSCLLWKGLPGFW